jgi:hypothetical protein
LKNAPPQPITHNNKKQKPTKKGVLNALLARDPAARRRGLGLRTYAVLPLADDCGVLQWVEHLVPFKGACEEAYAAERLYNRRTAPAQIRKLYDSWQGMRCAGSGGAWFGGWGG